MLRHHFKLVGATALSLAVGLAGATAFAEGMDEASQGLQRRAASQQGYRQQVGSTLQDSQIAAVISALHESEIRQANVARRLGRSEEVKAFAREMVSRHTAAQRRQSSLIRSLRLKTEQTRQSSAISEHGSRVVEFLEKQSGRSFDQVFMAVQVMGHRIRLRILDKELIPQAKGSALREELVRQRKEEAGHLARAREILRSLGKGKQVSGRQPAASQGGSRARQGTSAKPGSGSAYRGSAGTRQGATLQQGAGARRGATFQQGR
jgi:putative membrane protein